MTEKRTTRGDNGTPGVHSKFDVRRRVDGPSIIPVVTEDRSARDEYSRVVSELRGPVARQRLADVAREGLREEIRTAVPDAKYAHFTFDYNDDHDLVFGLTSTATHLVRVRSGDRDPSVPASEDLIELVSDYASDLDREHVEADREFHSWRPDTYTLSLEKPTVDAYEALRLALTAHEAAQAAIAATEIELNACATRAIAAIIGQEHEYAESVAFTVDEYDRLVAEYILHRDADGVEQTVSRDGVPRNNMLLHHLTHAARNVSGPRSDHSTLYWAANDPEPRIFYLFVDGS